MEFLLCYDITYVNKNITNCIVDDVSDIRDEYKLL